MPKFNECSQAEQIIFLKDEVIKGIEELMIDPAELKKILPEDKFKIVMDYMPQLKVEGCGCGSCINMDKLEARLPKELECLIDIARKRCEERVY